jgi:hypothetical protein
MASTGLSKTFSGAGTNNKKGTISFWLKRSGISSAQSFGLQTAGAGGGTAGLYFDSSDTLYFYLAYTSGSWKGLLRTNRLFRDTNAWYHFVVAWDTTQATESNRLKLYVNGVQETSFSTENYPPQDQATTFGNAQAHYINYSGSSNYFDGVMSHFYYTDGYTYAASDFGSTDSTTGEWKINTSPSVTYGTNGFLILKDGMTITDQSSNSNDFTLAAGTLTKTEDCPSNVFATMNSEDSYWMAATYSNGNNKVVTQGSHRTSMAATLGASSGKYYYEVKFDAETSGAGIVVGIDTKGASSCSIFNGSYCDEYTGRRTYGYGYYSNDGVVYNGGNNVGSYTSFSTGTIICVAVDLDNNKLYYRRNDNAWENSGDPTSGSTGTGAISITAASATDTGFYFPAISDGSNSGTATFSTNFGNGYFGTTAVSSAGTNASNIGIFEYDVPTGYTAWSTKGLNE